MKSFADAEQTETGAGFTAGGGARYIKALTFVTHENLKLGLRSLSHPHLSPLDPGVFDHVQEQLAHALEEQDFHALLDRRGNDLGLDTDGQAVVLVHPSSEPFQRARQIPL